MNIYELGATIVALVSGILLPMFWDNSPMTGYYNDEVDV